MSKNLPEEESTDGGLDGCRELATKGQLASHATMGTRQDREHHTVIELGHAPLFNQITTD